MLNVSVPRLDRLDFATLFGYDRVLMIPLLLFALLQEPAATFREKASGFTLEVPRDWTRQELENKTVAFLPPGPDGRQCTVLVLAGQDVDLDPAAAHDQLFQSAIQGSTVDGEIRKSTYAGWTLSHAKVRTAQLQELWTAVYSSKTGRRLEAFMLVASTEALFKAHRPTLEKMISSVEMPGVGKAPAPAAAGAAIHGLLIPVPPTWTRKDDSSGAVILIPPQLEGVRQYLLTVLPPSKLGGTRWEAHKALLKGVLGQVKWMDEPVAVHYPEAPGPFIRTSIAGKVPDGGMQQMELYTVAHDGVTEAVLGIAGIDRNVVEPVLKATTLKDPPKATERPRIVEAYRRLDQKRFLNREGGAMAAGSLMYERIWLRSDGLADFSTTYLEGYAASPLVLKVDPGLADGDFGTWKATGDQVHLVRRAGMPVEVYDRADGSLVREGKPWEPMPRVDGLKPAGRWALGPSCWIEFTADGKFSTDGALTQVAANDGDRPRPPEKGSGTYEIRDWTIFLTFPDGKTWSSDFSILGRDPQKFTSILLRTFVFSREK